LLFNTSSIVMMTPDRRHEWPDRALKGKIDDMV
jgi:hypothetical protein